MSEMSNPSIPSRLISLLLWKWQSPSCVQLCDPMYYTVHGILQARTLEWEAIPFSNPGTEPGSPALRADFLPTELSGKPIPDIPEGYLNLKEIKV